MGTCTVCGSQFGVQVCPKCGGSEALTGRQINKGLAKYSYPAFGGLAGIVIANFFYPMLDRDPFLIAGVCLFLVPGLFHVVSSFRKRLALDVGRIQRAYLCGGALSIFLALVMAGNGALDHSSATPVRTSLQCAEDRARVTRLGWARGGRVGRRKIWE